MSDFKYEAVPRTHNRTEDDPFCSHKDNDKDKHCPGIAVLRCRFFLEDGLFIEEMGIVDACEEHSQWLRDDVDSLMDTMSKAVEKKVNYKLIELVNSN